MKCSSTTASTDNNYNIIINNNKVNTSSTHEGMLHPYLTLRWLTGTISTILPRYRLETGISETAEVCVV